MVTKLNFPAPPGRTAEPNPNGPFSYWLPGPGLWTIDSGCVNPSNPAIYVNGVNVSGQPMYRSAQLGDVTGLNSPLYGINVKAAFLSTGNFDEAIFFHENACYITGREYGFTRNAATNVTNFYVANNANCFPPNTSNASCWNGYSWLTSNVATYQMPNVGLNSQGNYEYYYSAFVGIDPAGKPPTYWFRLTIQDPGSFAYVFDQVFTPPAVLQPDVKALETGTGYITTVLQSGEAGSYNTGGDFKLYGVWIGK